jgi:Amt family ammonium transporter
MSGNLAQDVWMLLCIGLVFFMQPGFLCLEAGAVRRKNAVNVAMKNFSVELVSTIGFLVLGYGLMFGSSNFGLFGTPRPLLAGAADREFLHFLFQAVFCGTAATIVSGAVAERLRFFPFVLESTLLCTVLYPLFGHWVWGGGWLAQRGFHDFAGSSVVHLMGAGVSLAGVILLGPRIGRFDAAGKPVDFPASDLVLSSLGTFILVFGWIGFNGGSAPLGDHTARIVASTLVAACFGGVTTMLTSWAVRGVSEIGLILNGTLGGLVAVTACADIIPFAASPLVGMLAGVSVHLATRALERLRLDDAVGAIPVHGACGVLGVFLAPLLATTDSVLARAARLGEDPSRLSWLGVQAVGTAACLGVSVGGGFVMWKIVSFFTALRVSPDGEAAGMNYSEHRLSDPVMDLLAASRRGSGAGFDLAALKGSELEPLAQALDRLLRELRETESDQVRLQGEVQSARLRMDQARHDARTGQETIGRSLADAISRLEHLSQFARSQAGGPGGPALQVVADLSDALVRSLAATDGQRALLDSQWLRVEEVSAMVSRIASRIGSGSAEARRG